MEDPPNHSIDRIDQNQINVIIAIVEQLLYKVVGQKTSIFWFLKTKIGKKKFKLWTFKTIYTDHDSVEDDSSEERVIQRSAESGSEEDISGEASSSNSGGGGGGNSNNFGGNVSGGGTGSSSGTGSGSGSNAFSSSPFGNINGNVDSEIKGNDYSNFEYGKFFLVQTVIHYFK